MRKFSLVGVALLLFTIQTKAIKAKFTVANMSVNVAEGSTGIFAAFLIYPNAFEI